MSMKARSLISTLDFTVDEQDEILALAGRMAAAPGDYGHLMGGRIMASLFFEPSTRTRLSFEAAMYRLGGHVIGFSEAGSSSTSKGESLSDTIRMADKYADLIVIRHPKEGAASVAGQNTKLPVINAGDGGREHPTQTLTDLMTVKQSKGRLGGLVIGCAGDLKFGRTIHSLARNIGRYKDVSFIFVSPEELRIPTFLRAHLDAEGVAYEETADLVGAIGRMDVLYMTRVQRERFFNEQDYIRLKDMYILDEKKMRIAKPDLAVLHPLPRVNEISREVDADPRAQYFEQAGWGLYARMALIAKLLGGA